SFRATKYSAFLSPVSKNHESLLALYFLAYSKSRSGSSLLGSTVKLMVTTDSSFLIRSWTSCRFFITLGHTIGQLAKKLFTIHILPLYFSDSNNRFCWSVNENSPTRWPSFPYTGNGALFSNTSTST